MTKGFFVTITKVNQRINKAISEKSDSYWKAQPCEDLKGWIPSRGESLEQAMQMQKEQYEAKSIIKAPLPYLVHHYDGPRASGKITRFISID